MVPRPWAEPPREQCLLGSSLHPAGGFQGTLGAGAVPLLAKPQLEGPTGTSMLPNYRIPVHAAQACLTGGAIWHGQGSSSSMGLLGLLSPCWTCSPVLPGMDRHGGTPFLLAQGLGERGPGPLPADQLPASVHRAGLRGPGFEPHP